MRTFHHGVIPCRLFDRAGHGSHTSASASASGPAISVIPADNASATSLSCLPHDLKTHIARFTGRTARAHLRLANRAFAAAGNEATQHVIVATRSELARALATYAPGGILELTLMGGDFTDADLQTLPPTL